ncbi:response regulator [Pseudomonas nitroreducens]|uniref:response regulator n=1 Tax=Pseudomonas nitroreducens TaxID=46680 RepID=UPI00265A532C|nr:response regulator [Pseudomonas nitroreducens]MCP1649804.1 two-component system sensor histidine kinase EvgS/two-component system response regulator EvgA [Pseudomonas nitroreducens]MCP1687468.1 two-component system sensor histidine kinase EvgS/two-component system response regulator EvgA [Pseudomonas nitroreducens]
MITVLLVDPTTIVRSALRDLLESMGLASVAEATDVPSALLLAREHRPGLVILEMALPGAGGLDLLRRLRARDPLQKLLVYSRQNPAHFAPLCFQAGASGFVSKDEDLAGLRKAIADVLAGRAHFAREYMQPGNGGELASLTPRELAVLQLIAEGHTNLRIAEQLRISFKTVSTYKGHLLEKLHVGSSVELAEIARRNGLVAGQESHVGALSAEALPLELGMLRGLVDAAPNPMFVRTIDGRLLFCNQRFLDYYHITAEEALNSGLADARWFPPAVRKTIPEAFRRLVNDGVPIAITNRVEIFGVPRVLHYWMVPYRDSSGQPAGMLGGLQDITSSEEHLIELRDRALGAEARLRQRSEFYLSSLSELAGRLEGMGLHPATPGLADLTARLARLRRICNLEDGQVPSMPVACELRALIGRCLAGQPASLFGAPDIDVDRVWLDVKVFSEWMASALALVQADSDTPVTLRLGMSAREHGRLGAQLTIHGRMAPQSIIDRCHAERLAEHLNGRFSYACEDDDVTVTLELELLMASLE